MSDVELARLRDENSRFQEWTWTVERVGWLVMGVVVVLGLLGVWAYGPLSKTTAVAAGGGYALTYDRFIRYTAPTELVLHIRRAPTSPIQVTVGNGLWKALGIQRIYPRPQRSFAAPDGIRFEFLPAADKGGTIAFSVKPSTMGPIGGTFAVNGAGALHLWQFVYP